ncbi:MAG: ribosomal protein S18-alanine N-acetyltransferase [Deltaproteobacteria bacterium]|nr:ribosomal protein S18-alanine N-acetyltransferase [Deltaproteobacteria bacterium]
MPGWSYVTLDESHIDGIVVVEKESFQQPWQRISFLNELSCRDALDVVVLDPQQGQTLAYACLRLILDEVHLLKIAVAPHWRRRGVATALLDVCFRLAQQRDVRRVYLEVRCSNAAAQKLYARVGFQIIARRPKYYADTGEDALIMIKSLEEAQ